ncbi:MAG: sigma-70 family RNA polymerase sigma factor [Bryobacteraceae bacterium]
MSICDMGDEARSFDLDAAIEGMQADFGPRVYYLALRHLRSHAAAEDVRNETLLRVIRSLRNDGVRNPDALPGFVLGVARNVIREQTRRSGTGHASVSEIDVAATEPEITVDHTDRHALGIALRRLSSRERQIIRYVFYDELSREEISRRLGILPDRVRLVKSRALKNFREIYARVTEPRRKLGDPK